METDRIEEGLADWIAAARATGCFADELDAAKTLLAVFGGLGEVLTEDERHALARFVPVALGDAMEAASGAAPRGQEALLAEVARRRGLSPADAKERTDLVCELVSSRLTDEVREKLVRDLPAPLGELFVLRHPRLERYPGHAPAPAPRDTLSSGRPGSKHPLSEAHPHGPRGPSTD